MLLFNVARICWKSANVKKFLPEGLLRYVLTQWWNWFLYVLGWIMKLVFFHYRSVKYFKQVLRVIYRSLLLSYASTYISVTAKPHALSAVHNYSSIWCLTKIQNWHEDVAFSIIFYWASRYLLHELQARWRQVRDAAFLRTARTDDCSQYAGDWGNVWETSAYSENCQKRNSGRQKYVVARRLHQVKMC